MCAYTLGLSDEIEPGTTCIGAIKCDTLGLACEICRDDLEGWIFGHYIADGDGEVTARSIDAIRDHGTRFADMCDRLIRRALADAGPGYTWHESTPGTVIGETPASSDYCSRCEW